MTVVKAPEDRSSVGESTLDPRRRISPKVSPGISTLGVAAASSTLEEPKKFKI